MGDKMSSLHQLLGLYIEFKPGLARYLHLGIEKQPLARFDVDDFPEIQGIADPELNLVPASPGQTVTARQFIQGAAQAPEKVVPEPAVGAAQCADRAVD